MSSPLNLFGEEDDTEDISKIKINAEFANRFKHNEERKDLHRLEELERRGIVDSETESSESEPEVFDDDDDIKQLMDGLVKVKNQDPIIKQKDAKLFDSEDEGSEEEEGDRKEKKSKPKYLKDVIAETLLEDGGEDEDDDSRVRPGGKSYNQEQEERRKKFLDVAEREFDDDDDEDLLKVKKRGEEEEDGENEEIKKKCDDYFGNDEGLDENEKFLKNFIVKKMWVDKEKGKRPQIDDLEVLSEDDEEVWDQLDFERKFNFRYEEGTGDRILGHSRVIEGAVRKKVNRREEQRKRREDRMAEANKRNREELKHLKNLKKKEIMEKLDKIRAIGGLTEGEACALDLHDLEDDFDPEEHDKKMKKTFNDDYYNAEDADFGSEDDDEDGDIEKPDFDKEDELLGLPKDWDVCGTGDGFAAVRERVLKSKAGTEDVEDEEHDDDDEDDEGEEHGDDDDDDEGEEHGDDHGDNESDQEEEEKPAEGKRKRKRKLSLREKVALFKEFDEYHKLDYEGTIGDLKTRFKYAPVQPLRFGLSAKEIINMDDKELNQYVPLKKIAPYTEVEWKVPKKLRNQLKIKNKLMEQEALSKHGKRPKNHGFKESRTVEPVAEEEKKVQVEKVIGDVGELSRKRKRKERQKEVKPSKQRMAVYGVGDPKPKKKKN
ncbi:hypothetical protein MKW92_052688 [Papaver armeniacum]|nr:hypothetical protein MKW92_052688 [Papaver armeniacum]